MVNMQRYMKVTSMPVLDFHSMTGFIIPSYHTNMEIDRSNSVGHPHLGVQLNKLNEHSAFVTHY